MSIRKLALEQNLTETIYSFQIIHRDLAARNILITEDHTCKVADFGFARDVTNTHIYERKSEGRLPIRWMAPESLYDNIFSTKSDVWSFGVLIWEVVTLGSTPYTGLSAAEVMKKVKQTLFTFVVKFETRSTSRFQGNQVCCTYQTDNRFYYMDRIFSKVCTFGEVKRVSDFFLTPEQLYPGLVKVEKHHYSILSVASSSVSSSLGAGCKHVHLLPFVECDCIQDIANSVIYNENCTTVYKKCLPCRTSRI